MPLLSVPLPPLPIYLDRRDQSRADGVRRAHQRPDSPPLWRLPPRAVREDREEPRSRPLPSVEYDGGEWKTAKLHPDCYVAVDGDYYSAPHIHRHKKLRIKLTEHHVEIFLNLERLAIHPRCRQKMGQRIKILEHFPANSDGVLRGDTAETAVAVALHPSGSEHPVPRALQRRRLRSYPPRPWAWSPPAPRKSVAPATTLASEHIGTAIATMRRYNRIRTPYFQELLKQARKQSMNSAAGARDRAPARQSLPSVRWRRRAAGH